jgi:hypothetical protein
MRSKTTVALKLCGLLFWPINGALAQDVEYGAATDIYFAHAKFPDGNSSGDVAISGSFITRFDGGFELEGVVSVSQAIVRDEHGLLFSGSVFGGLTLPSRSDIGTYIGIGIVGASYRTGCEYVYENNSPFLECRDTGRGFLSGGFRVGLKFKEFDDKRFRVMFSQSYGKDGFEAATLSFGIETQ